MCPPGFVGLYCEEDIDHCVDHLCSEHGVCLDLETNYTCLCLPGFEGQLCQLETNECDSFPCASGATCEDLISDYRCRCPLGFEGTRPSQANVLTSSLNQPSSVYGRTHSIKITMKFHILFWK